MKIQLPNGDRLYLEDNIEFKEKLIKVEDLVDKWSSTIEINWGNNNIKFFLDGLANYLVWHKDSEDKYKEDREVLSIKKVEEMVGKRKGKSIPFASLSKPQKEVILGEWGV